MKGQTVNNVPPRSKRKSLLPGAQPDETTSVSTPPARRRPPSTAQPVQDRPTQVEQDKPKNWNTRLPADLVHRLYGACTALAGVEENMHTHVAVTYRALDELLTKLENEHNGGEKFYADKSPFRNGPAPSYRRTS